MSNQNILMNPPMDYNHILCVPREKHIQRALDCGAWLKSTGVQCFCLSESRNGGVLRADSKTDI